MRDIAEYNKNLEVINNSVVTLVEGSKSEENPFKRLLVLCKGLITIYKDLDIENVYNDALWDDIGNLNDFTREEYFQLVLASEKLGIITGGDDQEDIDNVEGIIASNVFDFMRDAVRGFNDLSVYERCA